MARSGRGLDGLNFFVAAVQTGFGAFATVYLVKNHWPRWVRSGWRSPLARH